MAEENSNSVNLDLNLEPLDNPNDDGETESGSYPTVAMNLEDWLDNPVHRVREVVRRSQRWRSLLRQVPIPPETRNLARELISGNPSQTGEGSIAAAERPHELVKMCENGNGYTVDDTLGKKEDGGKNNGDQGSFFDCNICLDLAKDPVVTCCGHLFCWPCLYRWLNHHSDANECPVCKGEVTVKNLTPIYSSGSTTHGEHDVDSSLKIPQRPQARRVESWRQTIQRTAFTIPMEEMIRRLGSTFDLDREWAQRQSRNSDMPRESADRTSMERRSLFLNRFLSSRGMRRERTPAAPSDALTESNPNYDQIWDHLRHLIGRPDSRNPTTLTDLADSLAAERIVDSYFHSNPVERNPELPPPVDDRDSVSSIAAVIHSESQTVDNVVEIDSTVSLSISSRRRNDTSSRISDVDSGDSRATTRRRLH